MFVIKATIGLDRVVHNVKQFKMESAGAQIQTLATSLFVTQTINWLEESVSLLVAPTDV